MARRQWVHKIAHERTSIYTNKTLTSTSKYFLLSHLTKHHIYIYSQQSPNVWKTSAIKKRSKSAQFHRWKMIIGLVYLHIYAVHHHHLQFEMTERVKTSSIVLMYVSDDWFCFCCFNHEIKQKNNSAKLIAAIN